MDFRNQVHRFNAKTLRYLGLAKTHAWRIVLSMAYNLKRLLQLFTNSRIIPQLKKFYVPQPEIAGLG